LPTALEGSSIMRPYTSTSFCLHPRPSAKSADVKNTIAAVSRGAFILSTRDTIRFAQIIFLIPTIATEQSTAHRSPRPNPPPWTARRAFPYITRGPALRQNWADILAAALRTAWEGSIPTRHPWPPFGEALF
jgi:hypothetical protein